MVGNYPAFIPGGPSRSYGALSTATPVTNWPANVGNAAITGVLAGLGQLFSSWVPSNTYRYYEQQEQLYIQNGLEQARRLQLKGDIDLRNMEVAHAIERGKNTLGAAVSGGRLSGSTLDVLTQNNKYNVMDERTQQLSTLWAVQDAKRQGYINAINTAGQAMTTAYKQRSGALNALGAFAKAFTQSIAADKRSVDVQSSVLETMRQDKIYAKDYVDWYYGTRTDTDATRVTSNEVAPSLSPETVRTINSNTSASGLPLLQLNLDGSLVEGSLLRIGD